MNYEELTAFIISATFPPEMSLLDLDRAIDKPTNKNIGMAIVHFTGRSESFENDAIFARELIDYLDGMVFCEDNGETKELEL